MTGMSPDGDELEARIRALVFEGAARRDELNDLLRSNEKARPIAAKVLFEEAALISELRLHNARHWAAVLEPPNATPARESATSKVRPRRNMFVTLAGLAAAIALAVLWIDRDPQQDAPPIEPTVSNEELPIGVMRLLEGDGLSAQAIPVMKGREIELESERARIDLNSGVVLSLSGPVRMKVEHQRAKLWSGQVVVEVPHDREAFTIETDQGRFTERATVFSVSEEPDQRSELAVLSGQVRAELTTAEGDVLGWRWVKRAEGAIIESDHVGIRVLRATELQHDGPIPPGDAALKVSAAYRAAVDASKPMLLWNFEEPPTNGTLPNPSDPDLAGLIRGECEFMNEAGARSLRLGRGDRSGWIDGNGPWRKQDPEPFTVELWARPDHIQWGHLFQLRVETDKDPLTGAPPRGQVVYFCMEFTDSGVFGATPGNPAVRAVFRSPATERADMLFPGGVNAALTSPDRYAPGRWYHLVARVGTQDITLFINGDVAARQTISRPDHGEQELHLRLGRLFDGKNKSRQFAGGIDEVALYDRALSDEEVLKHYLAASENGD
ncbi:hypothetical protein HAHE_11860 [Haloferula helveola]|uniref:LamG-like jellyroll fold domain-containing protein n=2 Tax=Haloferula helveola TaxID=490095 RepID=A0ABM7R8D4_9BACT|nr:hypothetical protein HAHE_11860 [Haloferula helveola]